MNIYNSSDCQNLTYCGSISSKTILILPKNFLKSGFNVVELQSIVNLSCYWSNGYTMVILRSHFLGKERMQPFVHLSIVFWLCTALQYWSSLLSNFLGFHISSRPAAFLFLIFESTTLSSSCINCPSLMSSWSLLIGSSVIFVDFS